MTPISFHQACKQTLRRSGFGDIALHVHLGLAIWLGFVVTVGKGSLSSPWPLGLMLAVETGNEVMDRLRKGKWLWHETIADFVHTAFWPVMVLIFIHIGFIHE